MRVYKKIPLVLPEYRAKASPEFMDSANDEFPNYWDNSPKTLEIILEMELVLPQRESWSDEAIMFGQDGGNEAEIWTDDFSCKVDLRNFSLPLLQKMIGLANKLGCMLVMIESGEPIEPDLQLVLKEIEASRAFAFCKAPREFLSNLGPNN